MYGNELGGFRRLRDLGFRSIYQGKLHTGVHTTSIRTVDKSQLKPESMFLKVASGSPLKVAFRFTIFSYNPFSYKTFKREVRVKDLVPVGVMDRCSDQVITLGPFLNGCEWLLKDGWRHRWLMLFLIWVETNPKWLTVTGVKYYCVCVDFWRVSHLHGGDTFGRNVKKIEIELTIL